MFEIYFSAVAFEPGSSVAYSNVGVCSTIELQLLRYAIDQNEWSVVSYLINHSFQLIYLILETDSKLFSCQQTTFIKESALNIQTTPGLRPHGQVVRSADQLHLDLGSLLGYTVVRKN